MKTIESVMSQLTDAGTVMADAKEILRKIDAEYPAAEEAFHHGAQALRQALGEEKASCVDELISAQEQRIASNLIFLSWLGLQLNLSCFRDPVNKLLLRADCEDIHQEFLMDSLPATRTAQQLIDAARRKIPSALYPLTEPITSYYCHLEATAYKLAHYFGFRLADEFLYWVIPGYIHDRKTTCSYRTGLSNYLDVALT